MEILHCKIWCRKSDSIALQCCGKHAGICLFVNANDNKPPVAGLDLIDIWTSQNLSKQTLKLLKAHSFMCITQCLPPYLWTNERLTSNRYQIIQEYDHVPLQQGDEAEDWGINSENKLTQCYGMLHHQGFTAVIITVR